MVFVDSPPGRLFTLHHALGIRACYSPQPSDSSVRYSRDLLNVRKIRPTLNIEETLTILTLE